MGPDHDKLVGWQANPSMRPAFLVGCHRSGTTLLRYILDTHVDIACPPETKLLTALSQVVFHSQTVPALNALGVSQEALLVELGRVASRILETYATQKGKRRWVDKTPNYYTILEQIDAMFEHNAQYVFLTRHPFDSIVSLEEFFGSPSESHSDPEIARVAQRYGYGRLAWAKYWVEVNERILYAKEALGSRALLLRYEDLVRKPTDIVSRVLDFLEESQDPKVVLNAFQVSHDDGFQDSKIKMSSGLHRDSVYRAWNVLKARERSMVWNFVEDLATSLGYTADA